MYIGKVTNFFKKIGVAEIKIETHSLGLDDEIKIIGPTTGVYEDKISELRLDDGVQVKTASKGDVCSIKTSEVLRRGDKVYKIVTADAAIPNLIQH
jgi:putative protease